MSYKYNNKSKFHQKIKSENLWQKLDNLQIKSERINHGKKIRIMQKNTFFNFRFWKYIIEMSEEIEFER